MVGAKHSVFGNDLSMLSGGSIASQKDQYMALKTAFLEYTQDASDLEDAGACATMGYSDSCSIVGSHMDPIIIGMWFTPTLF